MLIYLKPLQKKYISNSENIHASKVSHVYPILHYSALPLSPKFTPKGNIHPKGTIFLYSFFFFKQNEIAVLMLFFHHRPPHPIMSSFCLQNKEILNRLKNLMICTT